MVNNIVSERTRIGLTQEQLAERVGVNECSVRRWEKDPTNIRVSKLLELSNLFGCSTDYLLGRSPDRTYHLVRA